MFKLECNTLPTRKI